MTFDNTEQLRDEIFQRIFWTTSNALHDLLPPPAAFETFRDPAISGFIREATTETMQCVYDHEDAVDDLLHEVSQRLHEFAASYDLVDFDLHQVAAQAVASRIVCHGKEVPHVAPSC